MGAAATARWRGVVRGTLGEGPGRWGAVTTKSRDLHRDSALGEGARGQKVRGLTQNGRAAHPKSGSNRCARATVQNAFGGYMRGQGKRKEKVIG